MLKAVSDGVQFLMSDFDRAYDLSRAGRFEESIEAYKRALCERPDEIGIIDGLAQSYRWIGDYRSAIPLMLQVHAYEKSRSRISLASCLD